MTSTRRPFIRRRRGERARPEVSRAATRDAVTAMIFARRGFGSDVARHLGVTPQCVSGWKRVPAHYVVAVAPLLGLTPEQIRPDIFGPPS